MAHAGTAVDVLRAHFGAAPRDVTRLAGGAFSRAFAADVEGRAVVVRLSAQPHAAESYAKDAFAASHFASDALPIPPIFGVGERSGVAFCVGARAPGRTLAECSSARRRALLPATLDTLDAIGRADTGATRGFGQWGADGDAEFDSWRAFLASVIENAAGGYYANWHALFDESFLERDVFDAVYRHMLRLLDACPNERRLVHTDYQFENALADDARITAVIDWGNAFYGDPLYDVARLYVWSEVADWWHPDGAAILRRRYGHLPRFEERLACYRCHIGLDDMRYYAKNDNRAQYDFYRVRLLELIGSRAS